MPSTLFTLGYEGLVIDAFFARLQAAQVKTVVDVRELPLSRKRSFQKSAFCSALPVIDGKSGESSQNTLEFIAACARSTWARGQFDIK